MAGLKGATRGEIEVVCLVDLKVDVKVVLMVDVKDSWWVMIAAVQLGSKKEMN